MGTIARFLGIDCTKFHPLVFLKVMIFRKTLKASPHLILKVTSNKLPRIYFNLVSVVLKVTSNKLPTYLFHICLGCLDRKN